MSSLRSSFRTDAGMEGSSNVIAVEKSLKLKICLKKHKLCNIFHVKKKYVSSRPVLKKSGLTLYGTKQAEKKVMKVNFDIFPILICAVSFDIKASASKLMNEYEAYDTEYSDRDTQVYDCRFWREPKQEIATIIMNNEIDKQASVFYFWNEASGECQPCSVCAEKTLTECTYVKDTVCISQLDWLKLGIKQNSGGQDRVNSDRKEDEGVIVYKALTPATRQPDVFGKPVYTDESVIEKESPTRTIQQKYGNRIFGKKIDVSADQTFGRPTFYAKDSHKNRNLQNNERPILTILREVLKNNQSRSVSVKDVLLRNVSEQIESKSIQIANTPGDPNKYDGYKLEFPWQRNVEKETTHRRPTTTTKTTMSFTKSTTPAIKEKSYHSIDIYNHDYPDDRKDAWPYRTDDKYSLFYYHPPKDVNEKDSEDEYNPRLEGDIGNDVSDPVYEYEYESKPAKVDQNLNVPYLGYPEPER